MPRATGFALRYGQTWNQRLVGFMSDAKSIGSNLTYSDMFFLFHSSQKDFVCFDFVSRHHNIVRYRKGQAMITDRFSTVCAWTMFDDDIEWKYDIMISKQPPDCLDCQSN